MKHSIAFISLADHPALDYNSAILHGLEMDDAIEKVVLITPSPVESGSAFHEDIIKGLSKIERVNTSSGLESDHCPYVRVFLKTICRNLKLWLWGKGGVSWRYILKQWKTAASQYSAVEKILKQRDVALIILDQRILKKSFNIQQNEQTWGIRYAIEDAAKMARASIILVGHSVFAADTVRWIRKLPKQSSFFSGHICYMHPTRWTDPEVPSVYGVETYSMGSPLTDTSWVNWCMRRTACAEEDKAVLYLPRSVYWGKETSSIGALSESEMIQQLSNVLTWKYWGSETKFVIKPRSLQGFEKCREILNQHIKNRWTFSSESVLSNLGKTRLVIGEFSAALVPFVLAGIPVLLFNQPHSLYEKQRELYPGLLKPLDECFPYKVADIEAQLRQGNFQINPAVVDGAKIKAESLFGEISMAEWLLLFGKLMNKNQG